MEGRGEEIRVKIKTRRIEWVRKSLGEETRQSGKKRKTENHSRRWGFKGGNKRFAVCY